MMKMKCRFFRMAAAILAAILFFTIEVHGLSAQKAILMDAKTGRVLYQKNCDERSLIASTTKIMTALVICEQCNVLDRVRIPKEAVGIEGSSMYLQEGEILTVQELLYGLMLHSGNDAAVALAIYCGGTVGGFAELMNDKAHLLGMENTHFENPSGLDSPAHYSTARDLAILACYAMENPIFQKTVSARNITIGDRFLKNHNKLLWRIPDVDGVKTGYTKAAGRILVSSANRQGRRLVAVTINAPDDWNDHNVLLEDGYRNYHMQKIVDQGDIVGYAHVIGGEKECISLVAAESFSYLLSAQETPKLVVPNTGFIYAPVYSGQDAGVIYVCIDDVVVGKLPVYYGEDVLSSSVRGKTIWERLTGGD